MRIILGFFFVLLLLVPLWNKARVWKIISAFLCIGFLLWLLLVFIFVLHPAKLPEMTQEKAQKLFETVGGVDVVNQEAKILFDRLGTNDWGFLFSKDLKSSPAISSLYSICENYSGKEYSGTSVAIFSEGGRHIEVKFGNHWSLKRIYIFDPNEAITFSPPSNWFQVTSNIFASK